MKFRTSLVAAIAVVALLSEAAALGAGQVTILLSPVGDPANAADPATGLGEVDYPYGIGTYDVTVSQYAVFLNAVARTDPYGLYNPELQLDANVAGIQRSGGPGSYTYSVIGASANDPVTYVSWLDAARFCNWLQNGQPRTGAENAGTTEEGAYTLDGDTNANGFTGTEARNAWANWWIPTESEWYKAAYYDQTLASGSGGYWTVPTRSNSVPGNDYADPGLPNQANYVAENPSTSSEVYCVTQSSTFSPTQPYLTPVGSFTNSASYYGTYDQGGDVWNWTSTFHPTSTNRVLRGGSWKFGEEGLVSGYDSVSEYPSGGFDDAGFRVAAIASATNTYIGNWVALLEPGDPSSPLNGKLTFDLAPGGEFKATLALLHGQYVFSNSLASDGTFSGSVVQRGAPTLQINVALQTAPDGTDIIGGTISNGSSTAIFAAERAIYSKTDEAPQAQLFTAWMAPPADAPAPQATGYATLAAGKTGGVTLAGKLPDGESVTASGVLVSGTAGPQILVYTTLNCASVATRGEKGFLAGALTLEKLAGSDFDGTLEWVKPQQAKGAYTAAIDTDLLVLGSLYHFKKGGSVLEGYTSGTLELSDTGALSISGGSQLEKTVTLTSANGLVVPAADAGPDKLKITITSSTGAFKGTFIYPGQSRPTTFRGVLFQDQIAGGGQFIGVDGIGNVKLTSP